jgi:hypothetical protein
VETLLINAIANVGFPAVIAIYLLVRLDKMHTEAIRAIHRLEISIVRLDTGLEGLSRALTRRQSTWESTLSRQSNKPSAT